MSNQPLAERLRPKTLDDYIGRYKVSFCTVALVTGLILLNGFLWILGLTWISLQKKTVVTGLRVE